METLSNKERGENVIPEAGDDAFFRFDIGALEALESKYGEDYIDVIMRGMAKGRVSVFLAVVSVSLKNMKGTFPFGLPLEKIQQYILDALFMSLYGMTFKERQVHEDAIFKERMKEAEGNPRLAAALLSQLSGEQATDQA